jgi:hypothetical protein
MSDAKTRVCKLEAAVAARGLTEGGPATMADDPRFFLAIGNILSAEELADFVGRWPEYLDLCRRSEPFDEANEPPDEIEAAILAVGRSEESDSFFSHL